MAVDRARGRARPNRHRRGVARRTSSVATREADRARRRGGRGPVPLVAPRGEEDADAEAPSAFKTSLGDDPAFSAALAADAPADPAGPSEEDFVAPTIDWGDVKPRALAEDDAFPKAAPRRRRSRPEAASAVEPVPVPELDAAAAAMAQSAADGFVPVPPRARTPRLLFRSRRRRPPIVRLSRCARSSTLARISSPTT